MMLYTHLASPIGRLLLAGDGQALAALGFPSGKGAVTPRTDWRREDGAFAEARRQLGEYFAGGRRVFDLALDLRGTEFQLRVWRELLTLPFGATTTYGAIAARIGRPTAFRAVGAANGANPIPIVVPCHRLVGADGSLIKFGGGLDAKRWLLAHEAG